MGCVCFSCTLARRQEKVEARGLLNYEHSIRYQRYRQQRMYEKRKPQLLHKVNPFLPFVLLDHAKVKAIEWHHKKICCHASNLEAYPHPPRNCLVPSHRSDINTMAITHDNNDGEDVMEKFHARAVLRCALCSIISIGTDPLHSYETLEVLGPC